MLYTRKIVSVLAVLTIAACSDATSPIGGHPLLSGSDSDIEAAVVGSYVADATHGQIVASEGNDPEVDFTTLGGVIELTLKSDGTSSGRIFIPEGGEDGGDFEADLAGTWDVTDGILRFEGEADTFVRDVDWVVSQSSIEAKDTFGDTSVAIVLEKI